MTVEKSVPEIRFEGFSGEWESKTIAELIDDELIYPPKDGNHGDIHPKATDYVKYGIPFIMANNIRGGKIQLRACYHISPEQAETLQKGFAKTGDVLLTHKGTVGEVAVVPQTEFPYLMLTPQVTYYRILGVSSLNTNFLATSFVTNSFQAPLKQEAGGGTRAYLGITAQQKLSISIPPKFEEQTKIGNTFQKLDSLINQHQQKHDKLSNIKKAMLEKMFAKQGETIPEIRFKGFSGEWEKKELGTDIAEIIGGGTPSTAISEFWDGDIDWYSPTEIGNNVYAEGSQKKITSLGLKNSSAKILPASNTILFTSRAGIGDMAILAKSGATNQGFQSLIVKEGFSPYFVYSAGKQIKEFALKHASGSTFLEISGKQLGRMNILMPYLKEQEQIACYFQKLDSLISQHQQQITKLNNIKQACLSKMFV